MTSTNWDVEALSRFQYADTAGMLWIDLCLEFERAYQEPRNEDLITRIYAFANWCLNQDDEGPEHLPTIVCTHFLEHIPTWPAAREDMPRWFTREEVIGMREIFSYLVGEDEFQKIIKLYRHRGKNA